MGLIGRFWYIFVLAIVLSLGASLGLIFLRKDTWMPEKRIPVEVVPREAVGATRSFREWDFRTAELETIREQLNAERERLRQREEELQLLRGQVQSEIEELQALKLELEQMRAAMDQEFVVIEQVEQRNLRALATVYAEMKAPAAVRILGEMDVLTVVKILSLMPQEASARILATMADAQEETTIRRAAQITDLMRKVK